MADEKRFDPYFVMIMMVVIVFLIIVNAVMYF